MSVGHDHWTNHLTQEESRKVDEIELDILDFKDRIAALRVEHRKLFVKGTGRMRRAKK